MGLIILAAGGVLYGGLCVKIMKPDERMTPACAKTDGIDFVPMKTWKNSLINLLNIAGTGPILGPIQGILFGPVAFILIPVGCVLGGAMHDYFSGMLSLRNGGVQMPTLIRKFTGEISHKVYMVFVVFLSLLIGAVFIYTPGDIVATQILGFSGSAGDISTWIIYGVIFAYYIVAVLFPIDTIIGRVYPIFGAVLLLSALGIFVGLFAGGYSLDELTAANWAGVHPVAGTNLIPIFFITVACGIVSGFHSTQTALIARSVTHEKQGRTTFFNMMLVEGFIAMVWAAAVMAVMNKGLAGIGTPPTDVIGIVSRDMLGSVGGLLAIAGVIVLPISTGDTALRGLRLMIAEQLNINQQSGSSRMKVSIPIFVLVAAILVWAKISPGGFTILWRYFAWSNQTIAVFAFAMITVYLQGRGYRLAPMMALIPGAWYAFITLAYIANAKIGFNIPMDISYILGVAFALAYCVVVYRHGVKARNASLPLEANPVYSA
jgi:carbon starvation protein CstA